MEFFRVLLKAIALVIGLPLTLGGFGGFCVGTFLIFFGHRIGEGILVAVGSVLGLTIGIILGKFASGNYD